MPVLRTCPSARWTPTWYGADQWSTCVLLIHRPPSLSVYSVQLKRMFRLGSESFWTAGWTSRPSSTIWNDIFWP